MQAPHKLGSDRSFTGLLPAVVTLVSIAIVWILLGKEAAFAWTNLAFAAFAVLAFYAWWQTRSLGYLASTLYLLACTLLLAVRNGYIPGGRAVAPAFSILLMVSMIFLLFMLLTRQTKWRGRDILELAAGPVAGETEAFTGRPRAVGRAEYTRDDVLDFARFARSKLIAMTYVEPDRIVFVPIKMGKEFSYLFGRDRDYSGDTWVAFGNDGQVTVNISRSDYVGFREDLDHDQLCQSLADVFLDFLHMHLEGQDARIVDRLDAMKIGVFS
jgi:hypothetical protein